MGIGNCCNIEEKEIADNRIKYYGRPSIKTQKYLTGEYFASRIESLNVSNLGGSLNPYFTYDLKVSSDYLVSCHGSSGIVINRYSNKSINFHTHITGSGGNTGLFNGSKQGDKQYQFWKGGAGGTRYGFDNFVGSYGVDFYTSSSIFIARGQDVVYYDIENNSYKNVDSFSGTIANKVACFGGYLFVGTCGYKNPSTYTGYNSSNFPEYGSFMENLIQQATQKQSSGIFVYDIDKILKGQNGFVKVITSSNWGNISDVTCMKSGVGRVAFGTVNGAGYIEIETDPTTNLQTPVAYGLGVGDIITSIDMVGEDIFTTTARHSSGAVFKNGHQLFSTENYQNQQWCSDSFIGCLDFDSFEFYDGAFAAVMPQPLDTYGISQRVLSAACPPINSKNTLEQIGTFPTGIGADENLVAVSLWQNGIYFFTHSGQLVGSRKSWVSIPESCNEFIRQDGSTDPSAYNAEYSISAGPIAVGDGDVFVADSVQFALGGVSGPLIYNPMKMYHTFEENSSFHTLTQGFNIFGGIIHFHD